MELPTSFLLEVKRRHGVKPNTRNSTHSATPISLTVLLATELRKPRMERMAVLDATLRDRM
jgi:hypothetical protein